ncbi:uncharacterized protein LOC129216626 [Uloborus diversus]|nr:uncharacterized protein LOC129216626 [Uloborus diversus]
MDQVLGDRLACTPTALMESIIQNEAIIDAEVIPEYVEQDLNAGEGAQEDNTVPESVSEAEESLKRSAEKTPKGQPARKRISLKEVVKNTVSSALEKFLEFEKEVEERNHEQNSKFQLELLDIERKKLSLMEKLFEK